MDSQSNGAQQGNLNPSKLVTIGLEDIQPKLAHWTNSIVVYVLGSNPPLTVMDDFLRRVCKSSGVNKVSLLNKGIYLVRMNSEEGMMKAISSGVQFFEKACYCPTVASRGKLYPKDVKSVPVWIKLHELEFKYWTDSVMDKLLTSIGKFRNADQNTQDRRKLSYTRVLVEMRLDKTWEQTLQFINEKGVMVTQAIEYERMPTYCGHCKVFGHDNTKCKKVGKIK
ncbi:hypothetical protein RDABS01_026355 [Bienertia sinuspersici]